MGESPYPKLAKDGTESGLDHISTYIEAKPSHMHTHRRHLIRCLNEVLNHIKWFNSCLGFHVYLIGLVQY